MNSSLEVYPQNAVCRSGLVTCKTCYNRSGNACVKGGTARLGERCQSVCDCQGNMFCNQEKLVCECFHAYEHWDDNKKMCVKREFGDACENEVQCDVFGSNNHGYTYSGGCCLENRCACDSDHARIVTGYVANARNALMGEKALCVINSSLPATNRNRGDRCTLDPIWFSGNYDALSSGVCGSRLLCYQCPDDHTAAGNDGKCRIATPAPAPERKAWR